jgi:hypothetical protein
MQRYVLLSACVLACAGLLPIRVLPDGSAAKAAATPPPEIYHVVTTALCARLHESVRPAVAMILQNDAKIDKAPPIFKRYQRGTLSALDPAMNPNGSSSPNTSDSIYNTSPETSMALQQMSYLVIPIARNIIAAQTLLDDKKLMAPTGNPADDATLAKVRAQLLETIAFQSASLDIINGFVQTQQMGELQHVGEEYLGAITGSDTTTPIVRPTPNQWQDPNTPGLPPNPYNLDVTAIPGLALGYNPLTKVMEGLTWLQVETGKRENAAGQTITAALSSCGNK